MISQAQKNAEEEDSSGSDSDPELSSEPETDRFGFILTNGSTAGRVGPPPELVRQRETKWINIILQWDSMLLKKTNKVKEQCQKGIPASLRAKCWPLLCAASDRMKKNKNLYQALDSQPALQSWVDVIERDLDRQFPFHEMFLCKDGHGQRGLFRVLKAYTQYQPTEGYCQAQGPVAAVLLMNMPVEEAFWCLVQISEQYLPGYYSPLLEGVLFDAGMLAWVLKRACPAAHKHLQLHEVEPLMFATDWLMCLFTRHLPFNTLLRVWDLFFCYGVRVLLQVAVVLVRRVLGRAEQRRQCQGQMETLERLRGVKAQVNDDDDAFIAEVCSVQLSSRDLKKQMAKELEKWRRDKPTSTFDPRGRCQGYRTAWMTVREKFEDRGRRKKDKDNLSVALTRSASTLSLSPSLFQKKLMKGGKAKAGEGSAKVVRHQSMGSKDDWRSWISLNLKKVQGLEEEEDAEEDKEPTGKSEGNDQLEEPTKIDKDPNTDIRQMEENENVREPNEAESERNETVFREGEKTNVGTEPNQGPTTDVQCTSQHEEEQEMNPNRQSQVQEQQTSEISTEETVGPVTGSESLDVVEENVFEKQEDYTDEAQRDQETDEVKVSGEAHMIQADLKTEEETENEQQTQVDTDLKRRTETIPDSETENNNEAATLTEPNLTPELEVQKKETKETDESLEDDVFESRMEDEEREESSDPPEMEMQEKETKESDRCPEGDQINEKYHGTESKPEIETSEELYNQTEMETGGEKADETDESLQDVVTESQTEEEMTEESSNPTEMEIQEEETKESDRHPEGDQMKEMYLSTPDRKTSEELYNQTEMETGGEKAEETDGGSQDDVTETETETNEGLNNQAGVETQEKETAEMNKSPESDQIKEMYQSTVSTTQSETREDLNDATETQEEEAAEKDESSHDYESEKEFHKETKKRKNKTAETDGNPESDHFKDMREESNNQSETEELETAETDEASQDKSDSQKETEGEDKVDTAHTEPNPDRDNETAAVNETMTSPPEINHQQEGNDEAADTDKSVKGSSEASEFDTAAEAAKQTVETILTMRSQLGGSETQDETTASLKEAEAVTLSKESDEKLSSVEMRSLEKPACAEPTGQVTQETDIKQNVPETEDVSISSSSTEVTDTPHTDIDLKRQEEDVSRKSTITSDKISDEHFTDPQESSQTHSIPDQTAHKRIKEQSNPGNVNTTHNSPEVSLKDNSLKSAEAVKQKKAAEKESSPTSKHFYLFHRLRGDQSKKTKEKRAQKMQVPKILIQDFSDGTGKLVQEGGEEKLSSRERRRRRRERERQEKEEEKSRKKKEKEMDKERERKKPQTRGKSFQNQKKTESNDSAQLTQIRFFNSYAESYF